jgi:large subunit ribosomal protein L17
MRHRVEGKKFGREKAHRTAMFRNLVKSMIISPQGRIETTVTKAKSLRSYVERLITYGKKDSVSSRRLAYSVLGNRTLVKKLFDEVAPQFQDRSGGYTRVLKTGFRKGDSAPMAIIEFVQMAEHKEEKKDDKKAKLAKKAKAEKKSVEAKKTKHENIKAADLVQ